jgi:hypothetical protein
LAKRKLSEKEPAKTNFDTWRAAQPALLGRVLTRAGLLGAEGRRLPVIRHHIGAG